jgi:hypothetical protein
MIRGQRLHTLETKAAYKGRKGEKVERSVNDHEENSFAFTSPIPEITQRSPNSKEWTAIEAKRRVSIERCSMGLHGMQQDSAQYAIRQQSQDDLTASSNHQIPSNIYTFCNTKLKRAKTKVDVEELTGVPDRSFHVFVPQYGISVGETSPVEVIIVPMTGLVIVNPVSRFEVVLEVPGPAETEIYGQDRERNGNQNQHSRPPDERESGYLLAFRSVNFLHQRLMLGFVVVVESRTRVEGPTSEIFRRDRRKTSDDPQLL